MTDPLYFIIPELDAKIRCTEDGRSSVYDLISAIGQQKDPYNVWKRLVAAHPEGLTKCQTFKFPGRGQQETPVTDLRGWLYILALLPGAMGKKYREEAAQLVTRYMKGDQTLIDEIKDRQPAPTSSDSSALVSREAIQRGHEFLELALKSLDGVTLGQSPEHDKILKRSLVIGATQTCIPELKTGLEPIRAKLYAVAYPESDNGNHNEVYLTPTALGKRLGISAKTMNGRLKLHGLQKKNRDFSKGQSAWLPTEEGKEYSILTVEEHKGEDPTRYEHLKWSERVLELFKSPVAA